MLLISGAESLVWAVRAMSGAQHFPFSFRCLEVRKVHFVILIALFSDNDRKVACSWVVETFLWRAA
jgi:hypothetical protein